MTTTEFMRLLEETRAQFNWVLAADTGYNAERRSKPRFLLRGRPAANAALSLGPLQALCYARTGKLFDTDAWEAAAKALEIDPDDAEALSFAANDRTWKGAEGDRDPDPRLQTVRRLLLDAVGLIAAQPEGQPKD